MKREQVRGWVASAGEKLRRFARYQWLQLLRIPATPENIAKGMAIGVFIGLIPLLPSQTLIAIGLAFLFKASKVAAAIGTLISNPFNWIFLYLLFYQIGRKILPFDIPPLSAAHMEPTALLAAGWRMAAAMLTGGFVLAVPSAVIAYMATLKGMRLYRERRAKRLAGKQGQSSREH